MFAVRFVFIMAIIAWEESKIEGRYSHCFRHKNQDYFTCLLRFFDFHFGSYEPQSNWCFLYFDYHYFLFNFAIFLPKQPHFSFDAVNIEIYCWPNRLIVLGLCFPPTNFPTKKQAIIRGKKNFYPKLVLTSLVTSIAPTAGPLTKSSS